MNQKAFEFIKNEYNSSYRIIQGDALSILRKFEANKFDLIITSPPYNLGKEYERKKSLKMYLKTQETVIKELFRVLKNSGSICWQVGNFIKEREVFPLDIFFYQIFKQHNFILRNRIIWHFGHGLHCTKRFSGRYETILWFTKSDNYTFNLDNVRIPSKYPNKKHYKGPKKGKLSGNPKGKNPSDVWDVLIRDWKSLFWKIPNVKSNHPEKTKHPCQFPIELVERCILALTDINSLVLDPYSGVGSTVIAAMKNNRNVIGIEKEKEYIDISRNRINDMINGNLRIRPMTKPIHAP
jgi:DNA modification methylase